MIVCVDIDGVLFQHHHRLHYILNPDGTKKQNPDWLTFYNETINDEPIEIGVELLRSLLDNFAVDVYLLTGRSEQHRDITHQQLQKHTNWLDIYDSYGDSILMRGKNDHRPAAVYKLATLKELRNIDKDVAIIDDDLTVIQAATENGFIGLWFCTPGKKYDIGRIHEESLKDASLAVDTVAK